MPKKCYLKHRLLFLFCLHSAARWTDYLIFGMFIDNTDEDSAKRSEIDIGLHSR